MSTMQLDVGTERRAEPPQPRLRMLPATRAECIDGPRPCPHTRCRHHLANDMRGQAHDIARSRVIPDADTCSLDVADRGPHTLDEIAGKLGGLSRERVRQIEQAALDSYRRALARLKQTEDFRP